MRFITFLFFILLILFGITFAVVNSSQVVLNYLIGQKTLSLAFVIAIAFALGALFAGLAMSWVLFKYKIKLYQLKKQLDTAK